MNSSYRYALDQGCCEAFSVLPARKRQTLLDFFRRLAGDPFMKGDYQEGDQRGFPVEVLLLADQFLLSWHTDHAAKEVRIIGLEIA